MYTNFLKVTLDLIVASVTLLVLSPVMIIIFLVLKLTSTEPVLFTQVRPGKNEKLFKIMKFRTMTNLRGPNNQLLDDNERITALGAFLRKYSLDELPQLFNVIKGEMSFVGPRPLLPEYLPLYNSLHKRRHEVKPGITGWAQVNGRNAIDWDTKLDLDIWYVDHISFLLDLQILFKTFLKIFNNSDVSSATHATMEKFTGSKT
ncbi:sugar transferase [Robertkochia flava]|uniref:sugar transferase n=1 Tax=Robertkochia flava TaxID=3447986 RepID=UPI001CCD97DD|nr:sugar transferase [Robertkochia marina]